jgi:hypothetical protein
MELKLHTRRCESVLPILIGTTGFCPKSGKTKNLGKRHLAFQWLRLLRSSLFIGPANLKVAVRLGSFLKSGLV